MFCDCNGTCEFPATTTAAEVGGEVCKRCGQNVADTAITWWSAPEELWLRVEGSEAGIRCITCFTKDCDEKGILIYWQAVEDGTAATPSISAAIAALKDIASQRLRSEIEPIDGEITGDFEYAYDKMIEVARASLQPSTPSELVNHKETDHAK